MPLSLIALALVLEAVQTAALAWLIVRALRYRPATPAPAPDLARFHADVEKLDQSLGGLDARLSGLEGRVDQHTLEIGALERWQKDASAELHNLHTEMRMAVDDVRVATREMREAVVHQIDRLIAAVSPKGTV